MSDHTASAGATRNRILIAVGTLVIVATYLYLVLARPAELESGKLGTASFIAMAGYTIGAVLIVWGAIKQLPTNTLVLIPVAIAVNIVIGQIVATLGLPIYLDSIGTILVAVLAGPAAGAATGALANVIWGLFNPFSLPFAVTSVVIGVLAGFAARIGVFRKFYWPPIAGLITGLIAAVISAPIAAFVFGGVTAAGTGALVGAFEAMGSTLLGATTLQGLVSDPLDKLITFWVVFFILAALPMRYRQRFPFVREHNVFVRRSEVGAGAPSPTAPKAPSAPNAPKAPEAPKPPQAPEA